MGSTGGDGAGLSSDGLPIRLVTVNDVVSMNLGHFRKAAGLSQQELANQIGWLKQVVSTAERSWEGRRTRNFTVGDLIDIAGGLGIPLAGLLLPPEDDGTAVTYVVDGLDGAGQQLLRDLVPMVMADDASYDGKSPVVKEFRRRLLAGKWRSHEDETALNAESWASQRAAGATGELLEVEDGNTTPAELADEWYILRLRHHHLSNQVERLQAERMQLERRVDELREFERDYRSRLSDHLENQYRTLWAGTAGVDPDLLLGALREEATNTPRVITVPDDEETPVTPLFAELPQADQRRLLAGMQDLRDRGIQGPYVSILEEDGTVKVMSATSGASVQVKEEPSGEGERLPAVLLPRSRDEEAARSKVPEAEGQGARSLVLPLLGAGRPRREAPSARGRTVPHQGGRRGRAVRDTGQGRRWCSGHRPEPEGRAVL
jgi:transcriptional regulator with XRE-family HTH domain